MREHLLAWQFKLYPDAHTRRQTLLIHLVTAPLFVWGCVTLACAVFRPVLAVIGLPAMLVALIAQGRMHALEAKPPIPFEGPLDFVSRFFAEQWVTFPRFVFSGGFARAWKGSAAVTTGSSDTPA